MRAGLKPSAFRLRVLGCCILSAALLVACDSFGLPAFQEASTPRPIGNDDAGILDIDPKFARVGEQGVSVKVQGLQTSFSDTTTVAFPDEPEITVTGVVLKDINELTFTLDVGSRATPGVHVLEIHTVANGTLRYSNGFTVVQ